MATVEVLGVHPVRDENDVHLIEMNIHEVEEPIDIEAFTQLIAGAPRSDLQVPYDEKVLDSKGEKVLADPWLARDPAVLTGNVRLAFFFHELDATRPLETPAGASSLPEPTPIPARLAFMEYEPP